MDTTVLIVPGLKDSGPVQWQSLWQLEHPEYVRALQQNRHTPRVAEWWADRW